MATLSGVVLVNGLPRDNVTVKLFRSTSFATAPVKNAAFPASGVIATVTSGDAHGADGAYRFTGISSGQYYAGADWNGAILWDSHNVQSDTDVATVLDYGAIGDGVTDDTAAFQTAVNDPAVGEVVVPSGVYAITQVDLPSNVKLTGQAGAELKSLNTTGIPLLTMEGTVSGTSSILTSDGTRGSATVNVASTTGFAIDDYVIVRDNTYFNVTDTAGRNQQILRVKSLTATSLTFYTPLNSTFTTAQVATAVKINPIAGSQISGLKLTIPSGKKGGGVYGFLAVDCLVENCDVRGCREWPAYRLDTCLNTGFRHCNARDAFDPTDVTGGAYGFILQEGCLDGFVEGCLSTNVREDLFSNNARNCRYVNNTVRGNRQGTNTHGSHCVDILIAHNLIDSNVFDGITVASQSSKTFDRNITIKGNVIQNCGASGIAAIGNLTEDNDGVVIEGNTIIDCGVTTATQYGIIVQRTNNVQILGNTIRNPNTTNIVRSLYVLTCDDVEVGHNLITDAPTHGISVSACNRAEIHHNRLKTITNDVFRDEGSNVGCVACFNQADTVAGKIQVTDVLCFGNQPAWGKGLDLTSLGLAISIASPTFGIEMEKTASDVTSAGMKLTNLSDNAAGGVEIIVKSGTADAASGGLGAFHGTYTTSVWRNRLVLFSDSIATGITYDATTDQRWRNAGAEQMVLTATALTLAEAVDLAFGTTTGTKLGTATTQKIGVWNATPIVRPSAYTQTYATATKTHSNPTATTLTDSTGGTANTTLQALPDPADAPGTADALRDDLVANLIPALRNNLADLAAAVNLLIADDANTKQVLNSVIDDQQAIGWFA